MALFKKKDTSRNVIDDTEMTSQTEKDRLVSIGSQFPGDTLRPPHYTDYPPFETYQSVLDDSLDILCEKEIDSGNGNVLDNEIIQMAREAKNDIFKQHEHHVVSIDMLLQRRLGLKKEYDIEYDMCKSDLKSIEEEITDLKHKYVEYKKGGKNHVGKIFKKDLVKRSDVDYERTAYSQISTF